LCSSNDEHEFCCDKIVCRSLLDIWTTAAMQYSPPVTLARTLASSICTHGWCAFYQLHERQSDSMAGASSGSLIGSTPLLRIFTQGSQELESSQQLYSEQPSPQRLRAQQERSSSVACACSRASTATAQSGQSTAGSMAGASSGASSLQFHAHEQHGVAVPRLRRQSAASIDVDTGLLPDAHMDSVRSPLWRWTSHAYEHAASRGVMTGLQASSSE
jgi:hypothetical protein